MAIAGKVAITPKGDWSSGTAYQKLDLVYYNNASYVAIQPSTGVAPTNTSYWMLALQSAGEADLEEVMDAINSIQSTSKGTLSTAGWYRVAEGTKVSMRAFSVAIHKGFGIYQNEVYKIDVVYNSSGRYDITPQSIIANAQVISKFRLTNDGTKDYAEIYLNKTADEGVSIIVSSYDVPGREMKAITPTLTQETSDGVTVTTTYDIPANASPVTDLDLGGMKFLTSLPEGITYQNNTMKEIITALPNNSILSVRSVGKPLVPREYSNLVVFKQSNQYAIAFAKSQYNNFMSFGGLGTTEEWQGWTDLDLANYLPLTGGAISGNVNFNSTAYISGKLSARNIEGRDNGGSGDGELHLNYSNGKKVYINGNEALHTGNMASYVLQLDGGGTVKSASSHAITTENTNGNTSLIRYRGTGGILGYIGYNAVDKPVVYSANLGTKELHHDGNSAKVHIGTSAPSDTSGAWIDTNE